MAESPDFIATRLEKATAGNPEKFNAAVPKILIVRPSTRSNKNRCAEKKSLTDRNARSYRRR
jgi:hypothetical protein